MSTQALMLFLAAALVAAVLILGLMSSKGGT